MPANYPHRSGEKLTTRVTAGRGLRGNGVMVAWRPGGTARLIGRASAVDLIFPLGPGVYVSDRSSGGFSAQAPGRF